MKTVQDPEIVIENIIKLRDELYKKSIADIWDLESRVMYWRLNNCLYRDKNNKLKET